ncbi:MAG: hypothetical protein R2759_06710 [Bacteroidales bacterium]
MKAITTYLNPAEGTVSVGQFNIHDSPDEVKEYRLSAKQRYTRNGHH